MQGKYENYKDAFYITPSKVEVEFFVNRYFDEVWNFDGNTIRKNVVSKNMSTTVEIPETSLTIPEFLSYSDEIKKYRASIVEPIPLEPKKY